MSSGNVVRLRTAYEPEPAWEIPVPRHKIARLHGVHPKTVDRWVSRDGMPEGECWVQVGHQRRYYPSRVRDWAKRHSLFRPV